MISQVRVAGVAGHHLVEAQDSQRRHHCPARPAAIFRFAVEALDQQHVLARGVRQAHGRHLEPRDRGQPHGHVFRLDHVVAVCRGGKLADELAVAVLDRGLGSRAANGGAVEQRRGQFRRQRHALLDSLRRAQQFLDARCLRRTGHVLARGVLEIERAGAIRT